ncbi:PilZ domain-containing protein [Oricola cellulosilytica]|uniref:PilZ domain-containing protein n=1 Tax=Oricola cellulosilytica TaxID=1429082 RepID=A0A4R0P2A0_9HYPH|nr:PilZ domain-containing protein [Oricola cellulosilytica]TCD10956.1 PilZ domain-containing protein [Oricola cellulosilytica]
MIAKGTILVQARTEQKRSSERHLARFGVLASTCRKRYRASVVDISTTGICIATETPNTLVNGESIQIACKALGYLDGTVRWSKLYRAGIEFNPSSNTAAKINAFLKYFRERSIAARR